MTSCAEASFVKNCEDIDIRHAAEVARVLAGATGVTPCPDEAAAGEDNS